MAPTKSGSSNLHCPKMKFSVKDFFSKYEQICIFLRLFRRSFPCVKSIRVRSFFGPYFPEFGLNTKRYGVSLRIQFEYGKIRSRKTPNTDTFHAVFKKYLKENLIFCVVLEVV